MTGASVPTWAVGLGVVSERRRRAAVDRIVRMHPAPVSELRALAARHPNAYMRAGALAALIRLRPRDLGSLLTRATRDPAMTVRMRVLGAVRAGHADDRVLAQLIADQSGGVRINAIDVAASQRVASVAPAIRRRLTDEKWYVRQRAAFAAGQLRDPRSLRGLHRLLQDPRPAVRRAAAEAIVMIGA